MKDKITANEILAKYEGHKGLSLNDDRIRCGRQQVIMAMVFIALCLFSCAPQRVIKYRATNKCAVYDDVTPLRDRADIPKSLRNDYPKR